MYFFSNCETTLQPDPEREAYLVYGIVDVAIDITLGVHSQWRVRVILVVFQEEMPESFCILILKGYHHLITQPKQHQLKQDR